MIRIRFSHQYIHVLFSISAQQKVYIGDEKLDLLSHYKLHDGLNLKLYPIISPGLIRQEIDKAIAGIF